MARTKNNCITYGSSGKMGHVVFTVDGRMRPKPDISRRVWTQPQKLHLERVEESKRYGRWAICDPELNEFYARKAADKHGLGAWHMAISDYFHPPEIMSADFRNVNRTKGRNIIICATDNFEVKKVMVSFISPASEILENGHADRESGHFAWNYRLKSDIGFVPGLSVFIRAMDVAGNITMVTLTWPFDCQNLVNFALPNVLQSGKKRLKSQLRIWNG